MSDCENPIQLVQPVSSQFKQTSNVIEHKIEPELLAVSHEYQDTHVPDKLRTAPTSATEAAAKCTKLRKQIGKKDRGHKTEHSAVLESIVVCHTCHALLFPETEVFPGQFLNRVFALIDHLNEKGVVVTQQHLDSGVFPWQTLVPLIEYYAFIDAWMLSLRYREAIVQNQNDMAMFFREWQNIRETLRSDIQRYQRIEVQDSQESLLNRTFSFHVARIKAFQGVRVADLSDE
uniref:Uncharacterized protein n=1 Tax=Daphnia galeata TaxID=27404 RepID=A0A8J2RRW9_9CRUS|nr:unnamed protein product [Daphnia galeata]